MGASKTRWRWILCCVLGVTGVADAQDCREAGAREQPVDMIAQGGRLYDNWWLVCGLAAPKDKHPAYPATAGQSGATTWRCKECHGWDYRGKDGAYGRGSHFTGIAGISAWAGKDDAAIVAILKNASHRFDTVLSAESLRRIAMFVSQGQGDAVSRIDAATRQVPGRPALGRPLYERQCIACHGATGRALNFSGKAGEPEYIGTIAVDNPWELLHKIRNGQPGALMDDKRLNAPSGEPSGLSDMPGMGGMHGRMGRHMIQGQAMPAQRGRLTLEQQLDLAAYLQTLPVR